MCFGVCCFRQCRRLQRKRTAHFMNDIDCGGHHFIGITFCNVTVVSFEQKLMFDEQQLFFNTAESIQ